jgi:hypothetical protein
MVDVNNGTVVSACEEPIAKLELGKVLAEDQFAQSSKPRHTFEESFEHAMRLISNLWKIWINYSFGP